MQAYIAGQKMIVNINGVEGRAQKDSRVKRIINIPMSGRPNIENNIL